MNNIKNKNKNNVRIAVHYAPLPKKKLFMTVNHWSKLTTLPRTNCITPHVDCTPPQTGKAHYRGHHLQPHQPDPRKQTTEAH